MPILKNKGVGALWKAILFQTLQVLYPEMTALILLVVFQNSGIQTFT